MTQWAAITEAISVALSGDRERGVELLARCWDGTGERDAAQRCVVAHYLADLQSTVDNEVAWDEAALLAFAEVAETDLTQVGIPSARALEPSLRLNLGDSYRRQGRIEQARAQAIAGQASADLLPADGYGATIRTGLTRLQERLDQPTQAGT
jgi:hypothetical protein